LGQQTTEGANVFHLATARGNFEILEEIVDRVFTPSPVFLRKLLNTTNIKGKTVLDMARYNKQIFKLIQQHGGEAAYEPGEEEQTRYVPESHHWNRRYHRAQWQTPASSSSSWWSRSSWDEKWTR